MNFLAILILYLVASIFLNVFYSAFQENTSNFTIAMITIVLAIAIIAASYYVWYLFYIIMLCPIFTFLPQIDAKTFAGIYFAFWLIELGDKVKN